MTKLCGQCKFFKRVSRYYSDHNGNNNCKGECLAPVPIWSNSFVEEPTIVYSWDRQAEDCKCFNPSSDLANDNKQEYKAFEMAKQSSNYRLSLFHRVAEQLSTEKK